MISDHEAKALGHARILEFHKFYSEYQLWLQAGGDRFKLKIRIFETNDGRFYFVQSHYVRVPNKDGPVTPTQLNYETPHLALSTAVESVTTYYDDAVESGEEPTLEWFVPNDLF